MTYEDKICELCDKKVRFWQGWCMGNIDDDKFGYYHTNCFKKTCPDRWRLFHDK